MQLSRLDVFLPEWLYLNPIRMRVFFGITYYCLCFQVVVHTYIALNRYTIFAHPLMHERVSRTIPVQTALLKLWTGSALRWIVVSMFLLPVPCASLYWGNSMTAVTFFNNDGTRYHSPIYGSPALALVRQSHRSELSLRNPGS